VLDEDDSNQVQSNEMGKFLKGKVAGFLIKNKASVVRLSDRELAAIASEKEEQTRAAEKSRAEREVARAKWHEKMSEKDGESRSRLAQQWREVKAREAVEAERRGNNLKRVAYKREMLIEMRLRALHTPVSTSAKDGLTVPLYDLSGRLGYDLSGLKGGGRSVPIYESERLATRMERATVVEGAQHPALHGKPAPSRWRWPGAPTRPVSPPARPSTGWVDCNEVESLSRLDELLNSPSISRRAGMSPPVSPRVVFGGRALQGGAGGEAASAAAAVGDTAKESDAAVGTDASAGALEARGPSRRRPMKQSVSLPAITHASKRPSTGDGPRLARAKVVQKQLLSFEGALVGSAAKFLPGGELGPPQTAADRRAIPRLSYTKALRDAY
jgi:hypothetical protein